ncbi:MAG: FAD-dependent oxidoreductase [Synechocystis sp.]|nr:FAD-dependent oxidoreductase [Synechocystis sp.]
MGTQIEQLTTEILVVGGGVGGTAAALQAARRGIKTILVSEGPWLGGMLTSAGVAAPDGNELAAWQTGIWGQFLRALQHQQPGGLDHGWVSLFTFDPRMGAKILADWVQQLPNLTWIANQTAIAVVQEGDRLGGVRFPHYEIRAQITLDGTELGDLLALGDIPHRWGWEWQGEFNEPSAPLGPNEMTEQYPVQSPTWVFLLRQAMGKASTRIDPPKIEVSQDFQTTWQRHGKTDFLTYGQLPDRHYMINWPIAGNDYGQDLNRLIGSQEDKQAYLQEAYDYSYTYAHYLQTEHSPTLELATGIFPQSGQRSSAFALHPYYRESRRLRGQGILTENNILPQGQVAPLPTHHDQVTSIAVGNYANDHHYPGYDFPLAPKSLQWGGRWTGTPFTIPFDAVLPVSGRGYLPCEKNISVSHIANGSSRLQPLVMNTGQAVGMIAALSIEQHCDPQDLAVRDVQEALIGDRQAPAAVIPLFNLTPDHPDWAHWQRYYLDHPDAYPESGYCPVNVAQAALPLTAAPTVYTGTLCKPEENCYQLILENREHSATNITLITERPEVYQQLQTLKADTKITVGGRYNPAGHWFVGMAIANFA